MLPGHADLPPAVRSRRHVLFILVTQDLRPILTADLARPLLRAAIADTRRERPFVLLAVVLLADHLHLLLKLPAGDADFATWLAAVKARFT